MQNPFTTTYSKSPELTYISTDKTDEILDNLSYEHPSESVYKITGVRGSGKTVILAKIEENLRSTENQEKGWLVFDLNPSRNMLEQMAAMLNKEGFGTEATIGRSFNVSANVFGTGGGIGFSSEKEHSFFDIGVEIESMLQDAQKKGKKVFIGIDEVSKTPEMIQFTAEFGKWLRAKAPVYMVCTGLYENILEVSNVKNLTFFRRASTIKTEPLNAVRMAEMYRKHLHIGTAEARKMAKITKGYAYAFQIFGVLYFKKQESDDADTLIPELKTELFAYSYEKIWEELSENDRFLVKLMTGKPEYKRSELLELMRDKAGSFSMYRDRLLKRGIIESRQSYVAFSLPFFADYIIDYCMD